MAKYLDENGLKTLISNIKNDIENTAWRDTDGNINENFRNQITQIIRDNLAASGITTKVNISDINSDLTKVLNLVFNKGNRITLSTGFSTEQKLINSGLIFEHTNNHSYTFSDDKVCKTSSIGTILVSPKDIKIYTSNTPNKLFENDIYAYDIQKSGELYSLSALTYDGSNYEYHSVTADVTYNSNNKSYQITSAELDNNNFTIFENKSFIVPGGVYIVTSPGSILNILEGMQYTINASGIHTSRIMDSYPSVENIIRELESSYEKLDFEELSIKAQYGDKIINNIETNEDDNIILDTFDIPYSDTGEHPVIELDAGYNNIIKLHISGSKLFGEIKLIPMSNNTVFQDENNSNYHSKYCGNSEPYMSYCLMYTGRGNLSAITQQSSDDIHHTVKISEGNNTKIKTSSIYPVALSKTSDHSQLVLFTLNPLDENLHIEN